MIRLLFLLALSLFALSFTTKTQEEISPQGDTRMGTDAATSGTDVDDKDIQAQEDATRNKPNTNQETEKKEIKTNGTDDHGLPTN